MSSDGDTDDSFSFEPRAKKKAPAKKAKPAGDKPAKPRKKPQTNGDLKTNGAVNGNAAESDGDDPMEVFTDINKSKEGLSIEKIYQKKTQLEHILLRPDTYIGSVEHTDKSPMWVYDADTQRIVQREISYVPGLYKIFDEVLVNAADNKQRDPKMNVIKIIINKEQNEISVYNSGKGIPVVHHAVEKVYVPELIFGTLLTSSNYDDDQRKVTGGRNGYGAKLCNIFSTKFTLETSSKEYKKVFKQTWINNMTKDKEPEVWPYEGSEYTKVTFRPDLAKFKMDHLDDDIIGLMSRRAYDIAGTTKGVKVYLNHKLLPVQGFQQYVEQYTNHNLDPHGEPYKMIFEAVNDRWDIAMTVSDKGFQQVSFVNSIATTKGGRHVDYIADQITSKLIEVIKKKIGKSGVNVKPFQVKNHIWVFVNALVENPTFDSQTKETLTLQAKKFGSKCELSKKFVDPMLKSGVVDAVMAWVRFKQQETLDKKCSTKKTSKLKGMPKLEDANDAGTKNSALCTLILTEGDSAKTLAVSGIGVVGRDRYGVFPLRGKLINVRDGNVKQIMENAEIAAMLKIIGLQYKLKYERDEEMKTLRYGKVMIMADQDQDGSHIKGLVINFIHHNWPALLKRNFVEEFITPIVKATKGKQEFSFFSLPEYAEWRNETENWKSFRIKYYKGLGTSTSKEAKEYFSDMARHRIKFRYGGGEDDECLDLAFNKKKAEERKLWITQWMHGRKERREQGLTEEYLYDKDTRSVTFKDFVNKELVLFSNEDNERSIPSLVDGLKPGQRKVMFTCFKRADKKEVKVAQLAGAVGEMSAYHHGEVSLMSTIVNLAQDYVGSNNINQLLPIGQFGTRLQGGKDSASPRYIFTQLNPVTKAVFPAVDENVLRFLFEENQRIEPEWYCPIIPMVLVNGADGIGTGWATKVPNYDPRKLVDNIRRLIRGEEMLPMKPWFKHFRGTIDKVGDQFVCHGVVSTLSEDTIEITELPIRVWTQKYKESVLEPMLEGTDKQPAIIQDFKEYHTDTTVRFVVKMNAQKMREIEAEGFHKVFKLQNSFLNSSMVLFDADGCIRKFNTVEEICTEYFECRKKKYIERKAFQEGMLRAQSQRLTNQARFILAKIKGEIVIENKRKVAIVEQLVKKGFDPDPVKRWKEIQKRKEMEATGEMEVEDEEQEEDEDEQSTTAAPQSPLKKDLAQKLSDYDYLVGMAILKLSEEEKDKLLKESDSKMEELRILENMTWSEMWNADLDNFLVELDKQEAKEEADAAVALKTAARKFQKEAGKGRKSAVFKAEVMPDPTAIRVEPSLGALVEKYEAKKEGAKAKKEKKVELDENGEPIVKPKRVQKPKQPKESGDSGPSKQKKRKPKDDEEEQSNGSDSFVVEDDVMEDEPDSNERKRKAIASDVDDDDDDFFGSMAKKYAGADAPSKKPAVTKKPSAKPKASPKKRAKKETKPKGKSKKDADIEMIEDDLNGSGIESSPEPSGTPPPRRVGGRERKATKYTDAFSDEDSDGSALSFEEPKKGGRKKKIESDSDFD